jgi:hypothetical protein
MAGKLDIRGFEVLQFLKQVFMFHRLCLLPFLITAESHTR